MKILGSYLIGGSTPTSTVGSWTDADLSGNVPFIIKDATLPAGYQELPDIEDWHKCGENAGADYKCIRKCIATIAAITGWGNLSTTEQQLVAQYFATVKSNRDEHYTTEQQIELGKAFHAYSVEARAHRVNQVRLELYNRLLPAEIATIMVNIGNLDNYYVFNGHEGTESGDPEGLYDFLDATVGTSYELTGVRAMTLTPEGYTDGDDFVDSMLVILRDGIPFP